MPKYRKMLSNWDAPYLQPMIQLIESQSKATLINWVLDYSEKVLLPLWERQVPGDNAPREAILAARA